MKRVTKRSYFVIAVLLALFICMPTFADMTGEITERQVVNENTTFTNVTATGLNNPTSPGGVIYNTAESIINGGTFSDNYAENGGVIQNDATLTIVSGLFENNSAKTNGGAVRNNGSGSILSIKDSTFNGNKVQYTSGMVYGGAIQNMLGKVDIDKTTFIGNKALKKENASTFNETKAYSSVLYNNSGIVTITNSTIKENVGDYMGGVIQNAGGTLYLTGNTFEDNNKIGESGTSGASVLLTNAGEMHLKDNTFKNNYGATLEGTDEGIINAQGAATVTFEGTHKFESNKASVIGVHAYNSPQITFVTGGTNTFTGNYAKDGAAIKNYIANRPATEGGVVTFEEGTTNTFSNNQAVNNGGAIFNERTITLNGTNTFTSNTATNGGAIYNEGNLIINGSTFTENHAENYTDLKGKGGAIYNAGTLNLNRTNTFSGNKAIESGGAIYNHMSGSITSLSGNFIANSAVSGGAIYNDGTIYSITGNFTENSATYGGAIYNSPSSISRIDSITGDFIANSAQEDGGAIFNRESNTIKSLIGDFTANSAKNGGAIHNAGSIGSLADIGINNSTFTNNTATTSGGAIYNKGEMYIKDSIFTDNTATTSGGAILNENSGTITFTGTNTFKGNMANGVANDIHNSGIMSTIELKSIYDSEYKLITQGVLNLDGGITGDGTIKLGQDTLFSTLNYEILGAEINADTIYADNGAKIAFDWGDTIKTNGFYITDTYVKANLILDGIYVDSATLDDITPGAGRTILFFTGDDYANLGSGTIANIFYNGSKFSISQEEKILELSRADSTVPQGLVDAVADTSNTTVFEFKGTDTETKTYDEKTLDTITSGNLVITGDKNSTKNEIIAGKSDMGGIKVGTETNTGHTLTMNNVNKVSGFGRDDEDGGFVNIAKGSTVTINAAKGGTTLSNMKAKIGGVFLNKSAHTFNSLGDAENRIVIEDNTAAQGGAGANIAVDTDAVSNISYTDFKYNKAIGSTDPYLESRGGALYNYSEGTNVATMNIANSTFEGNTATANGGAIYNGGNIYIKDSTFTGNLANSGGAIYNAGTITITDSTFTGNKTGENGGAIYNAAGGEIELLGDNVFDGNFEDFNGTSGNPNDIYNDGTISIDDITVGSTTIIGTTVINGGINGEGTLYLLGNSTLGFGNDNAQGVSILQDKLIMNSNSHLDMRNNLFDSIIVDGFGTMNRGTYEKTSISFDTDLSDFTSIKNDQISTNKIIIDSGAGNEVILSIKSVNVVKDNLQQLAPGEIGKLHLVVGKDSDNITDIDKLSIEPKPTIVGTVNRVYNFEQNTTGTSADRGDLIVSITRETGYTLPQVIQANTEGIVIDSYSLTKDQDLENDLGTLARYDSTNPRDLVIFGNDNTIFGNNNGGVTVDNENSLLLDDITMKNFKDDKVITVGSDGTVDIANGSSIDGNIVNQGSLNVQDSVIGVVKTNVTGNINNTGTLDLENSIVVGVISDASTPTGTINTQGNVAILGGSLDSTSIMAATAANANISNGTLTVAGDTKFTNTTIDNANLNLQSVVGTMPTEIQADLGNLTLNSDTTFSMDADLKEMTMGTIKVTSANLNDNTINLDVNTYSGVNTNKEFALDPFADATTRTALKDAINYQGQQIMSPIFKYNTNYDPETGLLNVAAAGGGKSYGDFNPSVFAGAVAAQMGGYLNQLNSYDNAFEHMDMYMLMTKDQRTAMKILNKYAAATEGANLVTYNPNQLADATRGVWFKPYASFEKVNLKGGPNVGNNMYGAFVGGDSDLIELKNGWDMMYSAYVSYDGSHQHYDGNSIWQNGGHLGATATWYKGNFFTGLTANAGASVALANTMYGTDNMTMLMAGVASKTGYNWELFNSKLIVQPSLLMSYSFVNMFDYTNKAGVSINSDPLHAIQIAPGLKFIGNLPHGWQPYVGVQMVWNIMDETKFSAVNVNLPELSTRPYFQYGIGVQKKWGDRFSGYAQAMLRNGGRTGIALSAGFRWALGKDVKNPDGIKTNNSIPNLPKTNINLSNAK